MSNACFTRLKDSGGHEKFKDPPGAEWGPLISGDGRSGIGVNLLANPHKLQPMTFTSRVISSLFDSEEEARIILI